MKTVLDEFSLEDHVAKNGFKYMYIDKLLAEHLSGVFPGVMFIVSRVDIRKFQ